jgi:hypothetical protein
LPAVASDLRATFARRRGRVARAGALALACLLPCAPARALDSSLEETKPSLRVTLGVDAFRVPGTVAASARYGGSWNVKAGTWLYNSGVEPHMPHLLLGGGYVLTKWKFRFGLGVVWIDSENDNVNGTRWNVDASVAYDLSDRWFVEYQHYSHGAILGIQDNVSNGGWNLVGVGLIF